MLAQNSCPYGSPSETVTPQNENSVWVSFTFCFQMLSSHRISPHLSLLSAKTACTRYMLHTTSHSEYSTRTVGKDYESLVCYTGNLAYFSVKEKLFSRIILVALMRTQDEMEHSGTCTIMALSSRTCRTSSLPFDTLR